MENNKQRRFTILLFSIYFIALIWIVLFKFSFHFSELDRYRNINLILYVGSAVTSEMILNVLAFVPFGIYMSMIKREWTFVKKVAPVFITSLFIESLQFIFRMGASDITDLLGNTLGGFMGVGIFYLFHFLAKEKTIKVLNLVAFVATIITIVFVSILLIVNR